MAEDGNGTSRIPQLDGPRGLTIFLVLGLHFRNDSNHGPFGSLLYRFESALRLGWAGVDLFIRRAWCRAAALLPPQWRGTPGRMFGCNGHNFARGQVKLIVSSGRLSDDS